MHSYEMFTLKRYCTTANAQSRNLMQREKEWDYSWNTEWRENPRQLEKLSRRVRCTVLTLAVSLSAASDLLLASPISQRAERRADGCGRSLRDVFIYCMCHTIKTSGLKRRGWFPNHVAHLLCLCSCLVIMNKCSPIHCKQTTVHDAKHQKYIVSMHLSTFYQNFTKKFKSAIYIPVYLNICSVYFLQTLVKNLSVLKSIFL